MQLLFAVSMFLVLANRKHKTCKKYHIISVSCNKNTSLCMHSCHVLRIFFCYFLSASQYNRYKSTFYLVFEFCEHDLAGLLSNMSVTFTLGEIKQVMKQLMNGLYYIHGNKILHRDMKAANILITKQGVLKLADFGLARAYSLSVRELQLFHIFFHTVNSASPQSRHFSCPS